MSRFRGVRAGRRLSERDGELFARLSQLGIGLGDCLGERRPRFGDDERSQVGVELIDGKYDRFGGQRAG